MAALFEFFAVIFLRLGIQPLLLFGGAHFRLCPDFAPRLAGGTLAGADDDELFIYRLFHRHGKEHYGIHEPRNGFQPHKEEDEHGSDRLGLVIDDGEGAVGIGDDLLNGVGDGGHGCDRFGGDIVRRPEAAVEDARHQARRGGDDDRIGRHGDAVAAEAVFPFQIIQSVGKQGHEHIRAGQAADVFDELPDEDDGQIGGRHPADGGADGVDDKARRGDVLFAELFRQRPHGEDADAHGDAAEHGYERLRDAVRIGA